MESKHHIAWADRLGLNKIWHDALEYCRMSYGTSEYRQAVFGLYHLMVNIKDGAQLKDIIDKYRNEEWETKVEVRLNQWSIENPALNDEPSIVQDETEKIRDDLMSDLFDFILQLLEDQGFGFYKSDIIDEDYNDKIDSTDDDEG